MSERRESGGLGPHDEQVAEWARALSEDPTSPVFYDLARALLARRAPKRAALVLKGALNHHPARDDARLLLGEALLASGRGRACTREMARILSRHPEHLEALKLLARALRFEGQRDEARVILERARELAPADTEVAGMLADLNTEGGFNAQLRQHFEAAGMFDTLREGLDILERRQTGDK